MSASFKLGPPTESSFNLFLKAQFGYSVQWPPKSTNLQNKVAIVTGANSGLGLEAADQLLALGLSTLIVAVRTLSKGEKAAVAFRNKYANADIQVWALEMESYDSILDFARRCDAALSRLDIVILNAGMQTGDFNLSSTGHEQLIQINYLSTVLLAILMLPVLRSKSSVDKPGRLSIVNSGSARGAVLSEPKGAPILAALDDQNRPWKPVERYAVSKLLAHLFILKLHEYVDPDEVVVNLVDPGLVKHTALQRFAPWPVALFFYGFKGVLGRTVPVGASTYVDAVAVKGKESHGSYLANWRISSYPAFVYTAEGEAAREVLWKETMAEFESMGAQSILEAMKPPA